MTDFLAVLKFLAILSTGIWGVIGLRVDYKDDDGKITKWGKYALFGTILSAIIAASIQGVEVHKQRGDEAAAQSKTRKELERHTELLVNIKRAIQPIQDITVTAWVRVPMEHKAFAGYTKRLRTGINAYVEKPEWKPNEIEVLDSFDYETFKRTVTGVRVYVTSPLFPDETKEAAAHNVLGERFSLSFRIYKKSKGGEITPTDFTAALNSRADLIFDVSTDGSAETHNPVMLNYGIPTEDIALQCNLLKADPAWWTSNGQLVAVPDLSESIMVINFGLQNAPLEVEYQDAFLGAMRGATIDLLFIRFGIREFRIANDDLKKHVDENERTCFVYQFPTLPD